MICQQCKDNGIENIAEEVGVLSQRKGVSQYIDDNEHCHIHDSNLKCKFYKCSHGHEMHGEQYEDKCPSCSEHVIFYTEGTTIDKSKYEWAKQ